MNLNRLFVAVFCSCCFVTAAQHPRLNEVLAANQSVWADASGDYDDWVELFNPGADSLQLAGYFLSDNSALPLKWVIPATNPDATLIPPQGFLLLWLDDESAEGPTHAPFKLNAAGETLLLTAPDGLTLADSVQFGPQTQDVSLGRWPDGDGPWTLFSAPTPLAANTTTVNLPICAAPIVSAAGGFYSQAFSLSLSCPTPDAEIRLRFDGEIPGPNDSLYSEPVDILNTTLLRARCFAPNYLPGPTATHTYFFSPPHSFPTISLVFKPADFFDSTGGIYTNWETLAELEKPLHAEWFEPDGTRGFGLDLAVELFGTGSVSLPQKSLLLKAKSSFGANEIEYPVFPDLPYDRYRRLVLRNSGQDWCVTQCRDAFVTDLVRHHDDQAPVLDRIHLDVQGFRPAVVYFNGVYKGIFNVHEHLGADFLERHYDLDEDQVDLIDFYSDAMTGDSIAWFEFFNWLQNNHFQDTAQFEQLAQQTDLANFTDYCIFQILSDNVDWPTKNWRRFRPKTPEGQWQWLPYDFDLSFGLYGLDGSWNSGFAGQNAFARAIDSTSQAWPNPDWSTLPLRRALEYTPYRHHFLNRSADFLNTVFLPARITERADQFEDLYLPEIEAHFGYWYQSPGWLPLWLDNMEKMRDFGQNRQAYCFNHVLESFPDEAVGLATVTLSAEPPEGGVIRFSTLHFDEAFLPWSGVYFQGIPIPVSAHARPGWHFAGWSAPDAGSNDSTQLVLTGDLDLVAYFEQDTVVYTGVTAPGQAHARLLPNPASHTVWVQLGENEAVVQIYNGMGRMIQETSCGSALSAIDVQGMPAGVYPVRVIFPEGRSVCQKLVIAGH